MLADWLREAADPAEVAFGRFLWAGVTASRFSADRVIDDPLYFSSQEEIAAVATAGYPARWVAALGLGPSPLTPGDWGWANTLDRVTVRVGSSAGVFARGLLAKRTVTLGEGLVEGTARVREPESSRRLPHPRSNNLLVLPVAGVQPPGSIGIRP